MAAHTVTDSRWLLPRQSCLKKVHRRHLPLSRANRLENYQDHQQGHPQALLST